MQTIFHFNRKRIYSRNERSSECFNMRNIPLKLGLTEKYNSLLAKVQRAENWTSEQFIMILVVKHFTAVVGLMVTILFLSVRLRTSLNMCRRG